MLAILVPVYIAAFPGLRVAVVGHIVEFGVQVLLQLRQYSGKFVQVYGAKKFASMFNLIQAYVGHLIVSFYA